jgi:squalene-hopene/tetraprenyl-beta-curcumene cyclase
MPKTPLIPQSRLRVVFIVMFLIALSTLQWIKAGESADWSKEKAGQYLDSREKAWFEFPSADRGSGVTKTSCICCHTLVPYALSRPALQKLLGTVMATDYEKKLLAQTKLRVQKWTILDSPQLELLYDFNEIKKKESWGTEAVLNAVILAFDDHYQRQVKYTEITKQAFANLWKEQIVVGSDKGSWDWLTFNLEPWESVGARYFGASLAAIAVGTAPGYYTRGNDAMLDQKVELLCSYLKNRIDDQHLYNRAWGLWASASVDGVLSKGQQKEIIDQILAKQREDGGWSLSSLGPFVRRDGSPQEPSSDGYATGLMLHILQCARVPMDNPGVAKGLQWLRANQSGTGEWRGVSLNKNRDPNTHVGKFMSDAATAFAVLALSH